MNFFRENKVIATFLGILVLGAIVMLVLALLAKGNYSTVTEEYESQLQELARLEGAKPYPNSENLESFSEAKEALEAELTELRNKVQKYEFSLEDVSPNEFQTILFDAVNSIKEQASGVMELPEDFYLGFGRYETELPSAAAAPQLARQVKALESLASTLIASGVNALTEINREELPVEKGIAATSDEKNAENEIPLVNRYPVNVKFLTDSRNFQRAINNITNAEKFFIIRTLVVENEKTEGPEKVATPVSAVSVDPVNALFGDITGQDSTAENTDGAESSPAPAPEDSRLEFVVGSEKLMASLRVEVVDFENLESDVEEDQE